MGLYNSLDPRPRPWRNGLGPASITPMAAPPVGSSPTGGLFVVGAGLGTGPGWLAGLAGLTWEFAPPIPRQGARGLMV